MYDDDPAFGPQPESTSPLATLPPRPDIAPPTAAPPARRGGALRFASTGLAVVVAAAVSGVVVHALDGGSSGTTTTSSSSLVSPVSGTGTASVTTALAKAEKSVVIINDTITSTSTGRGGFGFGGGTTTSSAAGTGIIISSNGEVVTNAHVVNGATDIKVTLPDGTVKSASIVGLNATKDLAVIKIAGVSGLTPATFANSNQVAVGDSVIAIGNAEGYGGSPSVTTGIISATNRSLASASEGNDSEENLSGLLQTDAAINPGNSGGPLVDSAGDVVGIDTAVATGTTDEPAQNIGFAIPSSTVVAALPALEKGGTTSSSSTATGGAVLGVEVSDDGSNDGATVEQVVAGSGAANAGLEAGDLITKVDSTTITDSADLSQAIAAEKPGDKVTITFIRNGSSQTTTATLGSASSSGQDG